MTLTLKLPPEIERKLRACAAAAGEDLETFALQTLEEKARAVEAPTFDEIFAPIREAVAESGMTDDEVDALLETALAEVRRERRIKDGKSS